MPSARARLRLAMNLRPPEMPWTNFEDENDDAEINGEDDRAVVRGRRQRPILIIT
jgi:hypothetical protein